MAQTEFSCPRCKKLGIKSQIHAGSGGINCEVNSEHKWNDSQVFASEGPEIEFVVEVPRNLPQEGRTPVTLSVPVGLMQALSARYADKTEATMVSILRQMDEGELLIIGKTDFDRLVAHLGKKPTSAGELVGMVYALKEEAKDQKELADIAVKDLKAYEGISPGRVVVDLGENYQTAVDMARGQELPLKFWVEQKLKDGITNNWF